MDTGQLLRVGPHTLRRLPEAMARRNAFCHCVYMHGVRPLGTSDGSWSKSTTEAFRKIVQEQPHVYLALLSAQVEVGDDGVKKVAVSLQYDENRTTHAFEDDVIVQTDVAVRLKEMGLLLIDQGARGDEDGMVSNC